MAIDRDSHKIMSEHTLWIQALRFSIIDYTIVCNNVKKVSGAM